MANKGYELGVQREFIYTGFSMNSRTGASLSLISPSSFEVILGLIISIGALIALFTPILYVGSDFETYFQFVEKKPTGVYGDYQDISAQVNSSKLAADTSVFTLWAITGLLGYALIASGMKVIANLEGLKDELNYTHANKRSVLIEALEHAVVRIGGLFGLYSLAEIFVTAIVPYILLLAHQSVGASGFMLALNLFIAFLIVMGTVHLATILIRLIVLKTRVFVPTYHL